MQDSIIKQHSYNHPIHDVWKAISSAEEISRWFIHADFEAVVGYAYTFKHEQTTITGRVLKANPVHELVYTWIVGGTDVETTVRWQLEASDTGTLLTLEHSGISNYPAETAMVMFENFKGGWASCLTSLFEFLNNKVT
jgi:uncharacterized protein YndB with AHSA1/START domain